MRNNAYFGMGSGPVLLSNLFCTGTEASLLECSRHNMYSTLHCTHRDDAGVTCQGVIITIYLFISTCVHLFNSLLMQFRVVTEMFVL